MSCAHCENRVKKAVGHLTGVKSVAVSLQEKTVSVELDTEVLDPIKVRETIEHEGYDVVS
jgi:copper chaperone CopZ